MSSAQRHLPRCNRSPTELRRRTGLRLSRNWSNLRRFRIRSSSTLTGSGWVLLFGKTPWRQRQRFRQRPKRVTPTSARTSTPPWVRRSQHWSWWDSPLPDRFGFRRAAPSSHSLERCCRCSVFSRPADTVGLRSDRCWSTAVCFLSATRGGSLNRDDERLASVRDPSEVGVAMLRACGTAERTQEKLESSCFDAGRRTLAWAGDIECFRTRSVQPDP